ncbi:MAG: hypothetical protein WC391_05445 [Methanoregula sp.]
MRIHDVDIHYPVIMVQHEVPFPLTGDGTRLPSTITTFFYRSRTPLTMRKVTSLILIFLAGSLLLIAGCAQTTPAGTTDSLSPAGSAADANALVPLALTASDLPSSFTIVESRPKTRDELSSLARDLGWESGYVVRSATTGALNGSSTEISQTIARYRQENIQRIVSLAGTQDQSRGDMVFYDLPLPATGENTRAFHGTVNVTAHETPSGFLRAGINEKPVEPSPTLQDFSEVLFTKGDVFEVIRISGTHADDGLLDNVSEIAYRKIR